MRLINYVELLQKDPSNGKLKKEYYKVSYELFFKFCSTSEKLEQLAIEEGISAEIIKANAKRYFCDVLKSTNYEFERKIIQQRNQEIWENQSHEIRLTPTNKLLLELMKEENPERIIKLIEQTNLSIKALRNPGVYNFVSSHFPDKKDELIDNLRSKISIYLEYESEKKKRIAMQQKQEEQQRILQEEQEYYKREKNILQEFVTYDYESKEEYCEINVTPLKTFDKVVELSRIYESDLYQKYCKKWQLQRSQRYAIFTEEIKKLLYFLKNNIIYENDQIRPFDIIDYYQLIKIEFDTVLNVIKDLKLSSEELKLIRTFIAKNKNNLYTNYNEIEQILKSTQEINCQKDKNGSLIPGTGKIVELSEKENIINFLKREHVPLNQRTYTFAFRRYLNGTLLLNENNKKIK